jgi:hypothetical protein
VRLVVWIAVLGAVGFGVYWFVIRPRRLAAAKAAGMTAIRAAVTTLRGNVVSMQAPLAVN